MLLLVLLLNLVKTVPPVFISVLFQLFRQVEIQVKRPFLGGKKGSTVDGCVVGGTRINEKEIHEVWTMILLSLPRYLFFCQWLYFVQLYIDEHKLN